MTLQLRNCEFAFQCNAEWDKLSETGQDSVRFCNECEKEVHRCETDDQLLRAIRSNLCVAIPSPYPADQPVRRMLLGSMRARPVPRKEEAIFSGFRYSVSMNEREGSAWMKNNQFDLAKRVFSSGGAK